MYNDIPTNNKIAKLHPKIRTEVAEVIQAVTKVLTGRATIRIVEGLRTIDYQNGLYALGRTKVNPDGKSPSKPLGNIVTNAKGGQSYHNFGLAVDFCLIIDGKNTSWDTVKDFDGDKLSDWMEVVKVFKSFGYEWGGDWVSFKDLPHFQKVFNQSWKNLLADYNAGHTFIDNGEKYVLIP